MMHKVRVIFLKAVQAAAGRLEALEPESTFQDSS